MRYAITLLLAASSLIPFVACGGPSAPPKSGPDQVEGEEGPGFAKADAASASTEDAGPTTTTTGLPETTGQPTPLPTAPIATPSTTAQTPTPPAQDCDPGRCLSDIQAAFQPKRPIARACYDAGLAKHPGIEGKLTISFEINPKGVVEKVALNTAESQITEPDVVNCVSEIFKKTPFPASPRGRKTSGNWRYEFFPKR